GAKPYRKDHQMSTIHRSRTTMLGIAAALSVVLVAPVGAQEKDHALAMAPTSAVEARRVVAAQQALQSGDLGSLQEEALLAAVAAGTSWDDTRGYGVVKASRVLAAQRALESADLGSMQEEALTAVVAAGSAEVEASVNDALQPTRGERLAQVRSIDLSFSRYLRAEHPGELSYEVGS
ncbi:MAG: hypothetical protein KY456_16090, partial [Chloroflexi bacterium]|nr:hypothetical protein [Chloroflexota bacterium]